MNTFNAVVENIDYFMGKWKSLVNSDDILKRATARKFIDVFQSTAAITVFDSDLYFKLVEKITIYYHSKLVISLLDGSEIECEIE